ncbi:phage terminase large subunit [Lysinibacillus sp. NPDC093712]|uniref:phage terminase large subunit n=1 Tax=Lysinibacillus sp. NPDC093712 TaxID=3390579 RepID=UPI003D02366F
MAWVDGEWINRSKREALIAVYREYIDTIDAKYSDSTGEVVIDDIISAGLIDDYYARLTELKRLERIHRCELDTLAFDIEYFSEAKNPGNAGNWDGFAITKPSESPQFHREITDILNVVSTDKVNAKIAVAAPRSHAKSTYLTKGFPLHQVVYRKRKYIIIISETPSVSGPNLEWLATQLKHNVKLRQDFGPLLSPRQQENDKDNSSEFIAWQPTQDGGKRQLTKVEAASTGQALRGRNWQGVRPDLIVCDDLEDAKTNAATPEQRAKLRDWFASVVMPLGDPKGAKTAVVYMGTAVALDCLLLNILYKRSDFESKVYRAIIDPPVNEHLWEQCREIYVDFDNPNRAADAESFYKTNKDAMDEGVRVLWQEFQPIWKLMTWKWNNGSKAFNTEYMNNPIDEESRVFAPENFVYWDDAEPNKTFPRSDYVITMGIDFAMGKQRGDFSACVTTATERKTGVHYIIDAYGARITPDKFLDVISDKVRAYTPDAIAAEAQMAQEFFVDILKEQLSHEGYPAHARVKKIQQRSRKDLRIESMLPDIESGKIRFKRSHSLLLEQFERYGQGAHDDLPDATEMSIRVSKNAKRDLIQKPAWL